MSKLSVTFQENNLIEFFEHYSVKQTSILEVKPNQHVIIFGKKNTGENLIDSFISEPNEYEIGAQHFVGASSVNILFLNVGQRVKRRWYSSYQPGDYPLQQKLTGEYSISITNTTLLFNFIKEHYESGGRLNNAFVDEWISFFIDQLLMQQGMNAKDIQKSPDLVTSYILKELSHELLKNYGVNLHKIKCLRSTDSPQNPIESEVKSTLEKEDYKPEQIVIESDPPPLHDNQKKYYRVKNGEQLGPYSSIEIQELIDQDELAPNELLWTKGLKDWKSADSFDIFIWD